MGLTIHYRIRLRPEDTGTGIVEPHEFVARAREAARKLQRQGRVDFVGPIRQGPEAWQFAPYWARYWPRCSERQLRRNLGEMNAMVASVAGALKDSADTRHAADRVEAPIFSHPRFERLEAEGAASPTGQHLREVITRVSEAVRDP